LTAERNEPEQEQNSDQSPTEAPVNLPPPPLVVVGGMHDDEEQPDRRDDAPDETADR
jgi:hypothetical protein